MDIKLELLVGDEVNQSSLYFPFQSLMAMGNIEFLSLEVLHLTLGLK